MRFCGTARLGRMLLAAVAPMAAAEAARATVTFTWLTVGNPGNPADTQAMTKGPVPDGTSGYGSVGYVYEISKYDVTNSQYTAFLNAVDPSGTNSLKLYDARMGSDPYSSATGVGGLAYQGGIHYNASAPSGDKYSVASGEASYPATWIYYDAGCRFVNWLVNGQGSGGTETGTYTMPALTSTAIPTRNPGSTVFIPSENEYYKAAYYDPTKNGTGGYWQYGVRSDTGPVSEGPPGGPTSANMPVDLYPIYNSPATYWQSGTYFDPNTNYLTNVGAYTATSYYGLSDVDGEVFNWTEGTKQFNGNTFPVYRGGAWYYGTYYDGAGVRNLYSFANVAAYAWYGLRLAGLPAPAISSSWSVDAGGSWSASGNWSNGIPNSAGSTATFGPIISLARSISMPDGETVGTLSLNSTHGYTISGAGTLTLEALSGASTVTVGAGSHTVGVAVALSGDANVSVASGSTLSMTGSLSTGGGAVNLTGGGTLVLSGAVTGSGNFSVTSSKLVAVTPLVPVTGTLTVNGAGASVSLAAPGVSGSNMVTGQFAAISVSASGSVSVAATNRASALPTVLVTAGLALDGTASLDLGNNDMLVQGGSEAALDALVGAWYDGGLRDGAGLNASSAGGAGVNALASLGVITNDDGTGSATPLYATFDGVASTTADVLVKYTYLGDTTLKGYVDATDLANTLAGLNGGLTGWENGDFTYAGSVSEVDVGLLLNSLAHQGASFGDPGTGGGAVPELAGPPVGVGGVWLLALRRTRR